jgi:hypothetical protein
MLAMLGDVHGFWELVVNYSKIAKDAGATALCQVGDFGVSWMELNKIRGSSLYPHIPVYVIEGNHEEFGQWVKVNDDNKIIEVMHNVFFVPRGYILNLDGLNILFLGGASSIDKKWQGDAWDWREDIQPSDIARFEENYNAFLEKHDGCEKINLMIAHVPPASVIERNFDKRNKLAFGVGLDWQDKSAPIVEDIWKKVGKPPLMVGHMHRKVVDGNCRILDINEMIFYPPASLLSAEEANAQMSPDVRAIQKERLNDLESVRRGRIIPSMNEPEPWEHPMELKPPLDKPNVS